MDQMGGPALVIANGALPSEKVLASLLTENPFILAVDGGADKLLSRGVLPDAVLGDFDSLSTDFPQSVERISAPDQNFTDLDKSVAYLVGHGYETIWIVGATGDRLDHTYGALSTLLKYGQTADIALIDEIGEARVVLGESTFETSIGQTISLMPLSDIPNVTTTGLRWNLTGEGLAPGVRDGISNVAVSDRVTISSPTAPVVIYLHHG